MNELRCQLLLIVVVAAPLITAPSHAASVATQGEVAAVTNWAPASYWARPASWMPVAAARATTGPQGVAQQAVSPLPSTPLPLVAIAPCRQYDSRSGAPLLDAIPQTVTVIGAPCGIPASAEAVAVNITIFDITGSHVNGVLRVGVSTPPPTAWINFPSTETQRSNAGELALTGAGELVLQVNMGSGSVDFTVDVFGYYTPVGIVNTLNTLSGDLTLAAGTNVSITPSGQTLMISTSVPTGPTGPTGPPGPEGPTGPVGPTGASGINSPLVFGPYASGSPDSGICGNNWADDTFTRTYIVSPRTDSSFDVTELFLGTFVTLAGASPNDCGVTLPAGITGQMYGDFAFTVPAQADFNFAASCPTGCGSVAFLNAFFGNNPATGLPWTDLPGSYAWQFHYRASNGSTWNNTDHGNTGNITP